MSDSKLPELPIAKEPDRGEPLDRYMTQQLTRAVPRPRDEPSPAPNEWLAKAKSNWRYIAAGSIALLVLVLALTADSATSGTASFAKSADAPESPDWMAAQIKAWRVAGLNPGGFAEVDPGPLGATACKGGSAAAIELTLCSFASAAAANGAVKAAERSVGKHTGVVIAEGDRMLIIADRRNADPKGESINRLAKTFEAR